MTENKPNWLLSKILSSKPAVNFAARVIEAHQSPKGFLPQYLFDAIPKVRGEIAIELAIFRIIEGKISVLLIKRDPNDPIWPGEPFYLPGTVERGPEARQTAIDRILNSELKENHIGQLHFAGDIKLESRRAKDETAMVYWAHGTGEPKVGQYFPIDNLPENIIEHHPRLIKQALRAFIGD